jgi:hypothetical protein
MNLELAEVSLWKQFVLKIAHVAGTRMILSAMDGLSRGELLLVDLTTDMRSQMTFDASPFSRRPYLKGWIASWVSENFSVTTPEDWFYNAHATGKYEVVNQHHLWVWDLPPGAALDAIEELGLARFNRHDYLIGIVMVPLFS